MVFGKIVSNMSANRQSLFNAASQMGVKVHNQAKAGIKRAQQGLSNMDKKLFPGDYQDDYIHISKREMNRMNKKMADGKARWEHDLEDWEL